MKLKLITDPEPWDVGVVPNPALMTAHQEAVERADSSLQSQVVIHHKYLRDYRVVSLAQWKSVSSHFADDELVFAVRPTKLVVERSSGDWQQAGPR